MIPSTGYTRGDLSIQFLRKVHMLYVLINAFNNFSHSLEHAGYGDTMLDTLRGAV